MDECTACGGALEAETFSAEHVIVAEGAADSAFLEALLAHRDVSGYQVARPARGKTRFGSRLSAIRANGRISRIRTIVLVSDSNGDPKVAFRDIVEQVRRVAEDEYGTPKDILKPAPPANSGFPSISVMLLPWADRQGNLETLLLDALTDAYPEVRRHVDAMVANTPARELPGIGAQSKARVACMVAAVCKDDPSCAVSAMWHSKKGLCQLLESPRFDPIVEHLKWLQE